MSIRLTKNEIYDVWRPSASPWTPWAKPVLFSFLSDIEPVMSHLPPQTPGWNVPFEQATAIVADLAGAQGIWAGLALARVGYRPVPVYNACPFSTYDPDVVASFTLSANRPGAATAVDVESILGALSQAAVALRQCPVGDNAPPVFLVDKTRHGHGRPEYGSFDNRSFVSVSDFPSAHFLKQHGIASVVYVGSDHKIGYDLIRVLLAWQGAAIRISYQQAWLDWQPEPKQIRPPWLLRQLWEQWILLFGYPARESGAFGEWARAASS